MLIIDKPCAAVLSPKLYKDLGTSQQGSDAKLVGYRINKVMGVRWKMSFSQSWIEPE
jgi:hypothetical protein